MMPWVMMLVQLLLLLLQRLPLPQCACTLRRPARWTSRA